ncbi:flagellar biosynthesis anti-sigma factor FlgM [Pseudomonas plecoglossicida]|uniref:flagellar biosynthesis anti-sigma factor FlgM n=1 Tax=Pseudomonas plecoglossicida TaxID=70775 RepID=UPI0005342F64|nr:flagellar biosynthesis anti-sigma factor FlgM [Pseudomonas plecoglossicida]GLR35371.1 hypothetical protein GCM10011247_07680 [Pseudomonas plecoglossicida]
MKVTGQPTIRLSNTNEARATSHCEHASASPVVAVPRASTQAALGQIQQELARMPQVDLEKVGRIQSELAAGELTLDNSSLAAAMVAFHRGDDR